MKFSEIVSRLGDIVTDHSLNTNENHNPDITGLAAIDEATTGNLSYVEGPKFFAWVGKTNASALILPQDKTLQVQAQERNIVWVATPESGLLFAKAIAFFYQPYRPNPEIHPTAVIHPTAEIGSDVYIGLHVVIQPRVKIGNGAIIHPNVVIYPDVTIGDRTTLHANCTIHERSQIGADCVIHSGVNTVRLR